jgi:hypothetical protein
MLSVRIISPFVFDKAEDVLSNCYFNGFYRKYRSANKSLNSDGFLSGGLENWCYLPLHQST